MYIALGIVGAFFGFLLSIPVSKYFTSISTLINQDAHIPTLTFLLWVIIMVCLAGYGYVVSFGKKLTDGEALDVPVHLGGLAFGVTVLFFTNYLMLSHPLIVLLAFLPYRILVLVGPAIFFTVLGFYFPRFVVGLIGLLTPSPASAAVAERHAEVTLPKAEIEKRLAGILEGEHANDREVQNLLSQYSPLTRWYKTLIYKRDAIRYEKVRTLQEAQLKAMKERNRVAQNTLNLERARRND